MSTFIWYPRLFDSEEYMISGSKDELELSGMWDFCTWDTYFKYEFWRSILLHFNVKSEIKTSSGLKSVWLSLPEHSFLHNYLLSIA